MLSIVETAQILGGLTPDAIHKRINRGAFEGIHIAKQGSRYFFPILEIAKLCCCESQEPSGLAIKIPKSVSQSVRSQKDFKARLASFSKLIDTQATKIRNSTKSDLPKAKSQVLKEAQQAHSEAVSETLALMEKLALTAKFGGATGGATTPPKIL